LITDTVLSDIIRVINNRCDREEKAKHKKHDSRSRFLGHFTVDGDVVNAESQQDESDEQRE